MSQDIFSMFGDVLGKYQQEMSESQKKFAEDIENQNSESDAALKRLAESLANKNKGQAKEITPEIARIVDVLQKAPQLVPIMLAMVDQYMADINAAVEAVNAKYTPKPADNGDVPSEES